MKYPQVKVELTGHDGNAHTIIGRCKDAACKAGLSKGEIEEFQLQAFSGDYDHLLQTCMEWFDVS